MKHLFVLEIYLSVCCWIQRSPLQLWADKSTRQHAAVHTFENSIAIRVWGHIYVKVINPLINPKAIKSSVLLGNVAMLLLELLWLVQTHCRHFWFFLCPMLWCPRSYFSLFLNSEQRSSVIYGEPEAQLGAEEEGTGGSKSGRKRAHCGALAWGCAVVTNFCQAEGLISEKILPIITTFLSLLPQLCDTALWSTTKHNRAKISSAQGAPFLAVVQSNPLLLKKKMSKRGSPSDVTALAKMAGRGQGHIAVYTRVCTTTQWKFNENMNFQKCFVFIWPIERKQFWLQTKTDTFFIIFYTRPFIAIKSLSGWKHVWERTGFGIFTRKEIILFTQHQAIVSLTYSKQIILDLR